MENLAYFILENARAVEYTVLGLFAVLCVSIVYTTTRETK